MREAQSKWVKDKTEIDQTIYICDCGGEMKSVGSAGCAHDDNWTYFFQCVKCKNVESSGTDKSRYGGELEQYGWTRIK